MILYKIIDETDYLVNEFNQKNMAINHLEVVEQLHPEHHYHIDKKQTQKKVNSEYSAPHLILNFGG